MRGLFKLARLASRGKESEIEVVSRRIWLQNLGLISASGAVMWACGSDKKDEADAEESKEDPAADAAIINVAQGLEKEAIELYTAAAGLTIWKTDTDKVVKDIAVSFAAHHTAHLATLDGAIADLAKKDATIKSPTYKTAEEYVKDATDAGADLTTVAGVLRLAAKKEAEAAQAYISNATNFTIKDIAGVSGQHGGDEAGHYGVLRAALLALYSDPSISAADKVIPGSVVSAFAQTL